MEIDPQLIGVTRVAAEGYAIAEGDGWVVGLRTVLTDELRREGMARDVVRLIQDARKKAGLDVAERINLSLNASGDVIDIIRQQTGYIAGEVLAKAISFTPEPAYPFRSQASIGGVKIEIAFDRHI